MDISFHCPDCSTRFRVPRNVGGKHARCRKCGTTLQIPAVTAETAIEQRESHIDSADPAGQGSAPPGPDANGTRWWPIWDPKTRTRLRWIACAVLILGPLIGALLSPAPTDGGDSGRRSSGKRGRPTAVATLDKVEVTVVNKRFAAFPSGWGRLPEIQGVWEIDLKITNRNRTQVACTWECWIEKNGRRFRPGPRDQDWAMWLSAGRSIRRSYSIEGPASYDKLRTRVYESFGSRLLRGLRESRTKG